MTTSVTSAGPDANQAATDFANKIFTAVLGTMETFSLSIWVIGWAGSTRWPAGR
jgi:hypothetical protein